MRGGQLEKAGHLIDAAAAIDPDAGDVLEARLRLSYLRADDKGARRHGEELLAHDPGSAVGQRMLGVLDFNRRLRRSRRRPARRRRGRVPERPRARRVGARGQGVPQSRVVAHPLASPAYGVWQTWIAAWALLLALRAAGLQTGAP